VAVAWRPSTRPCPAKKATQKIPDPTHCSSTSTSKKQKSPHAKCELGRDSLLLVLVRVNQVKPAACGLCYVFCHGAPGWGWMVRACLEKLSRRTVMRCRRISVASHRGCRCAENMSALDRYGTEKCEVGWVTLFGVVRYRRAMSGDVGLGLRGSEGVGMSSEMEGLTVIIC